MSLTKRLSFEPLSSNVVDVQINLEQAIEEIFDLEKFSSRVLAASDIEDILDELFPLIDSQLGVQVASVFLFSKEGCIERVGIWGTDRQGKVIPSDWLRGEKYRPGQSFSGKAVQGVPYGETNWSNNLTEEIKDSSYADEYIKKLGRLECAISVPLNGNRRTFGTLEVVNKVNRGEKFNKVEVCWLTVLGTHVAAAFSRLKIREKDKLFSYISNVLADPRNELPQVYSQGGNSEDKKLSVYKIVAEQLVSPLTPYKVCIIRLSFDGESASVVDAAHSDGSQGFQGRRDETRSANEGIVGKVFKSGQYEIVEKIENRKDEFLNLDWITAQGLKSYVCFPLTVLGNTIGVISLFVGYEYIFDESDIEFLQNVSYLMAAFKVRSERVKVTEDCEYNLKKIVHLSLKGVLSSMRGYLDNDRYEEAISLAEQALSMCKEYISEVENDDLVNQIKATTSYLELSRDLYQEKLLSQHKIIESKRNI